MWPCCEGRDNEELPRADPDNRKNHRQTSAPVRRNQWFELLNLMVIGAQTPAAD